VGRVVDDRKAPSCLEDLRVIFAVERIAVNDHPGTRARGQDGCDPAHIGRIRKDRLDPSRLEPFSTEPCEVRPLSSGGDDDDVASGVQPGLAQGEAAEEVADTNSRAGVRTQDHSAW